MGGATRRYMSGRFPSPCYASRGMTFIYITFTPRNDDKINTSSHICASDEGGKRDLVVGANDWGSTFGNRRVAGAIFLRVTDSHHLATQVGE